MPKRFTFYIDDKIHFRCQLHSGRCRSNNLGGERCRNKTVIGTGLCWRHLLKEKNLRIKPSVYGLGLFAQASNVNAGDNDILFKKDDVIIEYGGDLINLNTLNERYGENTAPYGVQMQGDNKYNDAACKRGIGSLVNHAPTARRNARFSFSRQGGVLQIKATKNIRNNKEILINYNEGAKSNNRYRFNEVGVRHVTK